MAEWPTTSVTSAEIVDGSIVDADVAAGAAIQASKLSGVETPSGAQTKADAAQAAAEATAATDATTKADAAEAAAVATAAVDATTKATAAQSGAEATAAAALTAHNALTDTAHGLPDTSTLIVEGDARLTDERTPTDGSVTAAKLASGQNLTLLGATFTGTVPGSLNAVKFSMSGASATSASTGGVVNITTTGHTGAGLVVYSNRGNDAGGRLVSIWADNPLFNQSAFYCRYDGVANAAVIDNQGSGTSNVALTVTSTNASDTTLGISGTQTTRAVLKITHTGGAGTSGAAITIQKDGTDTAAQGIFGDADATATGKWLNLRLGGAEVFVVSADGNLDAAGTITSGGTDVVLDDDARLSDARTPTTHAASHAAGGSDPVSALSIAALGLADTRAAVLARRWDFTTDPFDTDLGEWTVAGTAPTVSGGVMAPATASEFNLYRIGDEHRDVEVIGELVTPSTLTAGNSWSWLLRNVDSSNTLMVRLISASTTSFGIEIYKRTAGAFGLLASSSITTPSVSTSYWLLGRASGNTVTVEWWTTHPSKGGSPATMLTHDLTGSDITNHGAAVSGRFGIRHAGGGTQTVSSLSVRPLTGRVRRRQIQQFTASGTWTAPANALLDPDATYEVVGIGCGGPGGSGARQPSGTQTCGGGGGASGGVLRVRGLVSSLYATSGTVTIGAVGTPGAAVTTDGTNGNAGTASGNSAITGISDNGLNARPGSPGGAGGTSAPSAASPYANSIGGYYGGAPSVGNAGGSAGGPSAGSGSNDNAPGSGGAGGGIPASPAFKNGGTSTFHGTTTSAGTGGATDGAAGTAVSTRKIPVGLGLRAGHGAGGGASSILGAGGAGGSGATGGYGAGGGGGGSSLDGSNSGAGGAAGPSIMAIAFEWTEAG